MTALRTVVVWLGSVRLNSYDGGRSHSSLNVSHQHPRASRDGEGWCATGRSTIQYFSVRTFKVVWCIFPADSQYSGRLGRSQSPLNAPCQHSRVQYYEAHSKRANPTEERELSQLLVLLLLYCCTRYNLLVCRNHRPSTYNSFVLYPHNAGPGRIFRSAATRRRQTSNS